MDTEENRVFYESSVRFDADRIRAAAVYCSDGRFGDQFDELMHSALELPRYDRLAVPGGAACLASHFSTYREEEGVAEQLRFLVHVHGLDRVVLIAHENCAFYTERLQVSALQLESQQREDMKKAVRRVRSIGPSLRIDAFFARKNWQGAIQFESVEL
ncbi:MAG: carbonic anhydrase [Planctomycetota bacterium]|jgi:hypothetical protein